MEFYIRSSLFISLFILSSAQYHAQYRDSPQGYGPSGGGPTLQPAAPNPVRLSYPDPPARQSYDEPPRPRTPRPLILQHSQAQTHDGGFKYNFAADNGLQQGETISPDGTRTGAYSYVDSHGQQITVKYTAGKEGFRIIEGPHKTPDVAPHREPSQPQSEPSFRQQPSYTQPQQPLGGYSGPQTFSPHNEGNRYTHAFHRGPTIAAIAPPQPSQAPVPRYLTYKNSEESSSNDIKEPEYNDDPGKPYSFGNGYSFEFSGFRLVEELLYCYLLRMRQQLCIVQWTWKHWSLACIALSGIEVLYLLLELCFYIIKIK